ncbi:sensor histidine kinase [Oleiharenicola lentus]|uniref:sensor histidine kinase n=1 Tax=Oleiharenicola lentus TaxID=2508720 RepID=UPI003F67C0F5
MDASLNLLLVDDQRENLVALESLLTLPDYKLTSVTSARDAMIALLNKEFALIVLDVEMPEMNGIELARAIKERQKTRDVPIIFLSAHHDAEGDILTGYGAGAVDYVTKPLNVAILRSKVAAFVELYRKNRELKLANLALQSEIAERRLVEAALQEANRIKSERTAELHEMVQELEAFSYSIAHDMRAPLRAMQGFSHILRAEHADRLDEEGLEYLRRIASSATRLDRLIQDVLSYTKILRATTLLQPIDLDRLAHDMIATYPDWLPPRATVFIDGTLPRVSGNEAFLTQCFSNLVGNAVKFQPAGTHPRVRIWAEPREDEVCIWVEDNGIGIAPENHQRIFNLFEQVNAPSEYEGTGVGLAIVRKAVERMNGRYGFESALGHGSRFWFQLKAASA